MEQKHTAKFITQKIYKYFVNDISDPEKIEMLAMPDLNDLNEGDLKHKADFKNVYATVLRKRLDADDKEILGKQYEYMNFI